jgi:hypothetical protein
MPKTVYSTYISDDIDADFVSSFGDFDDIPPDVQVLNLHILGVKVSLHTLPKDLQSAVLRLETQSL